MASACEVADVVNSASVTGTGGLDVVVCDDDPAFRRMIGRALEGGGARVIASVSSFEELVDVLAVEEPDVVLLDVNLPGTNGIDGLTLLRERGLSVPVVILSADRRFASAAQAAGAATFVYKGQLRLVDLVERVREAAGA